MSNTKLTYLFAQSHTLATAVLNHAQEHLQASPQTLAALQQRLCYGLDCSALVYHALGRFEQYK
jgi:hypothetical protein